MLNLSLPESSSKKGITIIEIVLAIGFMGMAIVMFFSIMRSTDASANRIQRLDDFMLNGRYATEYIIEDVMLADEIVSMQDYYPGGIQQDDTLGFMLVNHNNGVNTDAKDYDKYFKYKYIYYRLTGDVIFRSTYSHNTFKPEEAPSNGGHNVLAKNVIAIGDSNFCPEDKLLFIEIETRDPNYGKEYRFMETKYLGKY